MSIEFSVHRISTSDVVLTFVANLEDMGPVGRYVLTLSILVSRVRQLYCRRDDPSVPSSHCCVGRVLCDASGPAPNLIHILTDKYSRTTQQRRD